MTKAFSKPRFLDASATATPAFDPPTSAISSTASLTSLQLGQEHYNCITHPGESVFSGPRPSVKRLSCGIHTAYDYFRRREAVTIKF